MTQSILQTGDTFYSDDSDDSDSDSDSDSDDSDSDDSDDSDEDDNGSSSEVSNVHERRCYVQTDYAIRMMKVTRNQKKVMMSQYV